MADLVPTNGDFPAVPSHDVRYIQYNIFGNLFEITNKYRPPVMPIGRGAYGILCLVLNSETKGMVAIKKIANAFDNHMDAKRTLREIKLLRHLDHENVIAIKDVIPPPLRREFSDVYIAMELMNTDLHQIIRSNRGLSEEHRQYFLYQILRGLKYIHSANVIHRDLKPSNLVLNANCDLKICDFGLACPTAKSNKNGLGLLLLSTSLSCSPPSSATVTTILNLSQIEENKAAIGRSGAIPLLVNLLECGGFCRKKDASTALYSFCSAKENKIRVVESGIMKPLVELMANFRSNMVDKSAYVLSILVSVLETCAALVEEGGIPVNPAGNWYTERADHDKA